MPDSYGFPSSSEQPAEGAQSADEARVDQVHREVVGDGESSQQAYDQALSGPAPARDLPAHETTHVDGQPIAAVAADKLAEYNAVRRMQGLSEIHPDQAQPAQPQQAPEQPEQQAPAAQPRDPQTGRFISPQEAAAYLTGYDPEPPMSPEDAQAVKQEQFARSLESGEAVAATGQIEEAYEAERERLNNLPGFETFANDEETQNRFDRVAGAYELEEGDPRMLSVAEQLYEETGGRARWGAEGGHQAEADAYAAALSSGAGRDEFGMPLPEDSEAAKQQRRFLEGEGP